MPKRIAVNTLFLMRDKKRVQVKPGQEVELTNEELADFKANAPDAIRHPINESAPTAQTGKGGKGNPGDEL